MGGYEWICADLYEDNAVMQSTGVTSGMWPGYVYNHNKYYRRSFEDRNISSYDDKTRDLYSKICEAEYKRMQRTTAKRQNRGTGKHTVRILKKHSENCAFFLYFFILNQSATSQRLSHP